MTSIELKENAKEILDKYYEKVYNKKVTVLNDDDVRIATYEAIQIAKDTNSIVVAFGSLYMSGIIRDIAIEKQI